MSFSAKTFAKFKRFYKPRSMKRFVGFDGKPARLPLVMPAPEKVKAVDFTSKREDDLARALRDEELAKRVVALQKKHPNSTVIEMLAMDWLDKNLATYVYQARVNGGYRPGGNVPDFLVQNQNKEWLALLIQGDYWHNVPGTQNDAADKLQLVGSYYGGKQIAKVIALWESRLMRGKHARDEAMLAAMQGIELGV